jgi:hypothetical protein
MRASSVAIGLIVFVFHALLSFAAWSVAPGNAAMPGLELPWALASFPLFYVLPAGPATINFWPILIVNSALWAVIVAIVVAVIRQRRVRFGS